MRPTHRALGLVATLALLVAVISSLFVTPASYHDMGTPSATSANTLASAYASLFSYHDM